MKSENTSSRLKHIMAERHLKQVDILNLAKPFCEEFGVKLGRNDLSQYLSGKVEPGQWKLTILGLALNVSEAWLMGYNVPMDREKPTPVSESGPTDPLNDKLTDLLLRATPEQKRAMIALLESMQPEI